MNHSMTLSMPEKRSFSLPETVKKYGMQLLGFIRGRVKVVEDAEDILQDVWYQLGSLTDPEEIESISGWLYRVARNKITDRYRKQKNELLDDLFYDDEEGEFSFGDILLADDSNNPELSFFKEVFWKTFREALDELPEKQRIVFIGNELENKTLQEIADASGEPLKTIISRKGYAVRHLRERLSALYGDFLE
ncbi:MAG: RNA polymerase subunit sigma-24 [Cytophagaceae bacterium SCN 52-12]|nr:MAG: RNA polymerase subunit sigma-24 [Cytophagaceae bacterium SCN 52-12]